MSRLTSVLLAWLLLSTMAAAQAVPPAPSGPQQVADLRKVFLINTNADQGVFDHISASVEQSGHWKIVDKREDADLLLVLSEKRETTVVMFNPNSVFFNVYYLSWPTTIEVDMLTLALVERATGRQLLTLSCARHRFPSAPRWLVSHLNRKLEKTDKSD